MKKIILFIAVQFLLIHVYLLNAQRIFSKTYTMDDGLSANRVFSILQDSCGFIWFGTDDGLNRFDGIKFKKYDLSEHTDFISCNSVRKILIDKNNKMWIGLDNGILIYDPIYDTFKRFSAKTLKGETIQAYINDIIEDDLGDIWIATNGMGLYRYNPQSQRLQVYRHNSKKSNSISQNIITNLCQDSKQNIWIGTYSEGLCCFDKNSEQFIIYKQNGSPYCLSDNSIQKIIEDSCGNLWIGTFQNGLDLFNYSSKKFKNFQDKSLENLSYHIHDIKEYKTGELLIASDNGVGLFKVSEGELIKVTDSHLKLANTSHKFVYTIYVDKEKSLWLGSYFDGVKFYSSFQNYFAFYACTPNNESKTGRVVNVIKEDKNGSYWIGTDDNGIFTFDPVSKHVQTFQDAASIGATYYCIHDLLIEDNKIFAATYGRGLEIFDIKTGKMKSYLHNPKDPNSIPSSRVFKLCKASNGRIFIGTSNGLCCYNQETDSFLQIGLSIGCVSCLIEDMQGRIWIGTNINGLYCYTIKTGKFTRYKYANNNKHSIIKNAITTLAIDHKKRLWIGTHGQGICQYNELEDNFIRYNHLELPNNIIASIIPKDNLLWISTNKGLVRFNPETGSLKAYSKSNGLYNEQFTPGADIQSSDGSISFGTANGFCSFFPQRLMENTYNQPIVLTNMDLFGKEICVNTPGSPITQSIEYTREITLTHEQSMVSFDFASLSYIAPKENQYQYILEGIDNEWQFGKGDNNHISYTNLPAGEYLLRVRGTNSDKIWSSNQIQVKIKVLPPLYKSKTAYALYTLAFLCLLFLLIKYITRRSKKKHRIEMEKMNADKEKELYNSKIDFFTNIAHEIRTPLSLIIGPLEYLTKNKSLNSVSGDYLEIIEHNYKRLYSLTNQLFDFRKIDAGVYELCYTSSELRSLIQKIMIIFELTITQKKINIDISQLPENIMIVTDEEAFTKIIGNLLTNAIKYTKSYIAIIAKETESTISITVVDDGPGIAKDEKKLIFNAFYQIKKNKKVNKQGIGIGLHMTHALVELMDGNIIANDRIDGKSGASISICFPKREKVDIEEKGAKGVDEIEGSLMLDDENTNHEIKKEKTLNELINRQYIIMLVDDNPEMLNFLSKVLSSDYFVISALNGEKALKILESNKVDLIVSDVVMDGLSGFELCQHVKTNINISHIPVVLLTAKVDTASKIEGLDSGADAYIEKPFSSFHLKAQLQNLLKKREEQQKRYASNPLSEICSTIHNELDEEFMDKCNEIILSNIGNQDFSVNILAQELGVSRTSVYSKIKGVVGITPNDFIKVTRLKTACKMMMESNYRATEIGFLVGFTSSSYFAKCFYKQFGMLPTEFMKSIK